MATNSRLFRVLFRLGVLSTWILVIGCAKTFYSTELSSEQKALICGYNVPWDRQECLDQANQQIEWCKEALGQEDDCWNTLLGDYSRYRKESQVSDTQYFEILHDPGKIGPVLQKLKRLHPNP
ncbi:MAG: hypothetical protein RLZ25_894 [Pseudomonadota bacterium]|jgi:hypothetical protein